MKKERRTTNPEEISDLVDSCQIDLRAFLGLPPSEKTNVVVEDFLKKGYSIDILHNKEGEPSTYIISRPVSKTAMEIAGIGYSKEVK